MRFTIALLALIAISVIADPSEPRWPTKFTEQFHEEFDYPVIGKYETEGTFYYDAGSMRYRVDRDNGHGDRYCALNGGKIFKNTPCSHIVVDGDRYMYYPELDECCYCCSAEHGCGLLRTDWLSGATFEGEVEYQGYMAYKWDKPGLQSNIYIETAEENPLDRKMLDMDQQPNDDQLFYPNTWSTTFDSSVLELPSICKKENSCALASTCTAVRNV